MNKKLIYHIYWGTSGNSGLYLDEIYQCLASAGYEQKVFVSYYYPFDYGNKIFFRLSDFEHCKFKGISRQIIQKIEFVWGLIVILFTAIIKRPDIINFSLAGNSYPFLRYFLIFLRFTSHSKMIVTCHDVCPFKETLDKNPHELKHREKFFKMADYLLVHNEKSKSDLGQYFNIHTEKILIHRFPIMDLKKLSIHYPESPKYDFLFIGNLRKEKGVDLLIDGWIKFSSRYKNAKLCICGYAPQEYDYLYNKLKELKIDSCLRFLNDEEYVHYLLSSRYVVFPYVNGTNSGVISTVLSLDRGIITSDIPMFKYNPLIDKNSIFKCGDSNALAEKLEEKYLQNPRSYQNEIAIYRSQFCDEVLAVYNRLIN